MTKTPEDLEWKPIEDFYKQKAKQLEETLARYNKANSESERLQIFNEVKWCFFRFDSLNNQLKQIKVNLEQLRQGRRNRMMEEVKPLLESIRHIQKKFGFEGEWCLNDVL